MIDIHTHIIPNIDDGSGSLEETVKMLEQAKKVGFTDVIATSHYIVDSVAPEKNVIEEAVKSVQAEVEKRNIGVNVFVGEEIFIVQDLDDIIKNEKIITLNNSKYVLVELPMNMKVKYLDDIIFKILNMKKVPIIAHPERYLYVQEDIGIVKKLMDDGVLFQGNFGSLLGLYGSRAKRTIKKLLKNDYIHFLASDCHKADTVYSNMTSAFKELLRIIELEKIEKLTVTNPKKVIGNQPI